MNKRTKITNAAHSKASQTYNGAELKPIVGRPNAMDAYDLPSLVNGVRVPRKKPLLNAESKK